MEGKKSFLLYCDMITLVEQLPDEIAGKLFKIIFQYVNDRNPEPDDLMLKIAFEPIKQQLKRDLVQWQEFINKQKNNGLKGGRPPKPTKTQDNPKNPTVISDNPKNPTTVTDTVNVNDNVNKENIHPLQTFVKTLPTVSKMKYQLTFKESEELIKDFPKEKIKEILEAMENNRDLVKKNQYISRTLRNWIRMRSNNTPARASKERSVPKIFPHDPAITK